jgi:signal transduction histidine kinase
VSIRRDPTRALQIGFLALLVISFAQVGWWIVDYMLYAREVHDRFVLLYDTEADILSELMLDAGARDRIASGLPHLEIDAATGRASVRAEAIDALMRDESRRMNRTLWEGGFFLAVLLGGMGVLTRTIRHDADLRRRQQNFLAAVSHEFKSPLASMRLAAETLVLRAPEPDAQRLGQRILEDGERLLRMVDNLLDTTRLEEGRHRFAPETLPLAPLVETCVAELSERARSAGIRIMAEVPADLRVKADPEAVGSIVRNLLDNAVKACSAKGEAEIRITARAAPDAVELAVEDTGIGFPPEDAEMIFEKFYRVGDELRRSTPGTGLGLYIVKRLAELSQGTIAAASAGPGRGARFTVRWPREGEA